MRVRLFWLLFACMASAGMPPIDRAFAELVGAVLGAREDDRALVALGVDERREVGALLALLDEGHLLVDEVDGGLLGRHRDAYRIAQDASWRGPRCRSASWPRRAGSAARLGSSAMILRTSRMKPMSSMRSASSRTTISTESRRTWPSCMEVEQAAGRGDEDVDALGSRP